MLEFAVKCQAAFVLVVGEQGRQTVHFGHGRARVDGKAVSVRSKCTNAMRYRERENKKERLVEECCTYVDSSSATSYLYCAAE